MTTPSDTAEHARPTKSQRTRQTILLAAETLFSEHGYDATSLDAIGRRAGIQGSAVLYHYATKRQLYEAVLDRLFGPLVGELYALLDEDGPLDDRLVAVTSAMVRFAAQRPSAARLLLRETSAGSADAQDIVGRATARHWEHLLGVLTSEREYHSGFDPLLVWNIVVGAVCFHFSAGPTIGGPGADPTDPAQVEFFDRVMTDLTRSLCTAGTLGVVDGQRPVDASRPRPGRGGAVTTADG